MNGKTTCKTCGKVWNSFKEYQKDNVKCGSNTCTQKEPMLSRTAQREAGKQQPGEQLKAERLRSFLEMKRQQKGIRVLASMHKIPDEVDPHKIEAYYVDVPEVISIKLIRNL